MQIAAGPRNYGAIPFGMTPKDIQTHARSYGFPGGFVNSVGSGGSAPMELPKAIVRIGEQALWSAYQWPVATTLATKTGKLFSTALDGNGQGFGTTPLSLAETNIREPGRIPSGYSFAVAGIACQWYRATTADSTSAVPFYGNDVRQVLANGVLRWAFLQASIEIAPCYLIGAGGGAFGVSADTGDNEGNRSQIAVGNGQVWIYQNSPVLLPSSTTFGVEQVWGALAGYFQTAGSGGATNPVVERVCLLGQFTSAIPTA